MEIVFKVSPVSGGGPPEYRIPQPSLGATTAHVKQFVANNYPPVPEYVTRNTEQELADKLLGRKVTEGYKNKEPNIPYPHPPGTLG